MLPIIVIVNLICQSCFLTLKKVQVKDHQ